MKSVEQTVEEARAVELFRALANPVRFRIVQSLAQRGECVVGDLVLELPAALETLRSTFDLIDPACCAPLTTEQSVTEESVR